MLSFVEINNNSSHQATIIWLHGLGADGYDFAPIVDKLQLNQKVRFIFPHAPIKKVTINNNMPMRAWFDISVNKLDSLDFDVNFQDIIKSSDLILQLIEKETSPEEKIYLAGFSQGGVMALYTFLTNNLNLGGIITLSSFLPDSSLQLKKTNNKSPLFIAHGKNDNVIPFSYGEHTYKMLKNYNYNVTWHSYPIDHSVSEQETKDLERWLNATLDGAN